MCLALSQDHAKTASKKQGTRRVYKFYELSSLDAKRVMNLDTGFNAVSPYMDTQYRLQTGNEIVSNREYFDMPRKGLHPSETRALQVSYGFHVYLNKKDALSAMTMFGAEILIELDAKASNKVSDGTFRSRKSAVYSRLTPRRILKQSHA